MRKTRTLAAVATVLLGEPHGRHWGYELSRRSGVATGTLYPMLGRLLDRGWLEDGWEDPVGGRPPRRYYRLTREGEQGLRAMTAKTS